MDHNMEVLIHEISSGNLKTKFGKFKIYYFSDGREDAVALVKGDDIYGETDVLCRIHSQCFFAEAFYSVECDCAEQLEHALKTIQEQGGILIYLFQVGRNYGLVPLISTQDLKEQGMSQQEAYKRKGFYGIERSFDIAAKILLYFDIKSIKLITKNMEKVNGIRKYGITVKDAGLNSSVVIFDKKIQFDYNQIEILPITGNTVVIISDLNVDKVLYLHDDGKFCGFNEGIREMTGGCAFNSACIFKKENLDPVILGSVGEDLEGKHILKDLEENDLKAFIYISNRPTGKSQLLYRNGNREICSECENANEYDSRIAVMLDAMRLSEKNLVYITTHILIRGMKENVFAIVNSIYKTHAKIVIDIVPHNIYNCTTWKFFCEVFNRPVFMVICELKTILLLHSQCNYTIGEEDLVDDQIFDAILEEVYSSNLDIKYLVLRYGYQNIGKQRVYENRGGKFCLRSDEETDFKNLEPEKCRGYGEVLTAKLLKKYCYEV